MADLVPLDTVYFVRDATEHRPPGDVICEVGEGGFVHLCTGEQIPHVLAHWFGEVEAVAISEIDWSLVSDTVRMEQGSKGESELFPHLYGPLRKEVVGRTMTFRRVEGSFDHLVIPPRPQTHDLQLCALDAWETESLRRSVLRHGTPTAPVRIEQDLWPTTFHFGAKAAGEVVATSTFIEAPCRHVASERPYQLRFMAVDPAFQGTGLGERVLMAGITELRAHGASILWADARDNAIGFYVRLGFKVIENSHFVSELTGIPHVVITYDL